jgi:hypothetical protein
MSPPKSRSKKQARNRTAGKPAREQYRLRLLSGMCLKTSDVYPALQQEGFGCGCFDCFPAAYCAFEDEGENRCREPRFTAKEAKNTPYCYNHWLQLVRRREMASVAEIIKFIVGPALGSEVKR